MTRRRAAPPADSLELLLDTICNAFGGILFLSILLVMLLRLARPADADPARSAADAARLAAMARELEQLLAELETLERSLALQTQTRARLTDADLEARYARLEALRHERQVLERTIAERNQQIVAAQQRVGELAQREQALDQALAAAETQLRSAGETLATERGRRTRSVVPPHTRSTSKRELALIVRYGRIYQPDRWDDLLIRRRPNLDDFLYLGESGGQSRLTPKPYRGLEIDEAGAFAGPLRGLLARHPPETWYVCLAVWDDSFEPYQNLKRELVGLGYDLRLLALAEGEFLFEGPVADPQVQ